jgi:hypothetical protein
MIDSQTAHLTHKPYSESTESHSGSVHGRARKSALEELIANFAIPVVSVSPATVAAAAAGAILVVIPIIMAISVTSSARGGNDKNYS